MIKPPGYRFCAGLLPGERSNRLARSVFTLLPARFFFLIFIFYKNALMYRKKPDVDVIKDVLRVTREAFPNSSFIQSLSFQYQERGGLSKKQLDGLYKKAAKIPTMPVNWLATLEAEILKRPTRYRSALPPPTPLYSKDENTGRVILSILEKYPQHKRVLFLKSKSDNNEPLSASELIELERFQKLLC